MPALGPPHRSPLLVGIAGGSASGKTTLGRALVALLPGLSTSLLHHDDYYRDRSHLPVDERARLNFDRPSMLDNRAFARDLGALRAGQPVHSPRYCFVTHARLRETTLVEPADVVLVEGMLLLAVRAVREQLNLKVFVDAPADLRLARRVLRDIGPERGRSPEFVVEQYLHHVRPMHEKHVAPSKRFADIVVTDATDPKQTRRVAAAIGELIGRR